MAHFAVWFFFFFIFRLQLVDPCCPESSIEFQKNILGHDIGLNSTLDDAEQERRIARFYRPFHQAADIVANQLTHPKVVVSVRSFHPSIRVPSVDGMGGYYDLILHHSGNFHTKNACEAIASLVVEWGFNAGVRDAGVEGLVSTAMIAHNPPATTLVDRLASKLNCEGMVVEARSDILRDESWRNAFEEVLRVAIAETFGEARPVLSNERN
eukprot:c16110_g1_i2.p1 GENE.c16110_g1_i2~~c16110_g1_i2.p1  ORF type:complete len:211 (+),score=44.96 c16110_g1_i2:19-651(+)